MGRPKAFDEETVLDIVVEQFWTSGYKALSVRDLEASTGVLKGSLYAAFGNKRALLLAALARYSDESLRDMRKILARGATPRAAIERYLRRRLRDCTGARRERGCLLANTAAEVAPHDPEVRALVGRSFAAIADELEVVVRAAQAQGEIGAHHDPRALAEHLVVLVQGMSVVGKTEPEASLVRSAMRIALAMLDEHPPEEKS